MEIQNIFNTTYLKVQYRIEKILHVKYWEYKVALLLTVFSLITSFPDYQQQNSFLMQGIQQQFDAPFTPLPTEYVGTDPEHNKGVSSHLSKRWIRIAVPLVGHYLHIRADQWFWVQHLLGFFFFLFSLKLVGKYLQDKILAVLFVAGLSGIFVGKWIFNDLYHFDSTAYFILLLSMYYSRLGVIVPLLTATFFIDERAIMVSPCIYLWWYLQQVGLQINIKRILMVVSSLFTSILFYYLIKKFMILHYGFIPVHSQVVLHVIIDNFKFLPAGYILHYEAFWLLIATTSVLLWKNNFKIFGFLLLMSLLTMNFVCFMVYDVGRSTGYIFPLLFVYLYILVKLSSIQEYRRFIFLCSLICILIPTHAVWGDGIFWMSPIFPKILKLYNFVKMS